MFYRGEQPAEECAVFPGTGIEGAVFHSSVEPFYLSREGNGGGGEVGGREAFPDVVHGEGCEVEHVVGVVAVVAEFVEDDLVGGEVVDVGEALAQGVDGEEKSGLAELVAVGAVLPVADGADGEEYLEGGVGLQEFVKKVGVVGDDVLDGEAVALEFPGGNLVAVGDDDAAADVAVDPGGTPGDDEKVEAGKFPAGVVEAGVDVVEAGVRVGGGEGTVVLEADPLAADGKEVIGGESLAGEQEPQGAGDGGGVVDDAAGVDVGVEFVPAEFLADVLGEAGAEEQQAGGMGNVEGGGGDLYRGL